MKHSVTLVLALLQGLTAAVVAQPRLGIKPGENVITIEVYNRSNQAFIDLQARFASGRPSWLSPRGLTGGRLSEFKSEKSLGRNRLLLQLPFDVAASGLEGGEAKIELVSQDQVLGTFSVLLGGAPLSGSLSSTSSDVSVVLNKNGHDNNASLEEMTLESAPTVVPVQFALRQNYPNPFNPNTVIRFELPQPGLVQLRLYDMLGQEVKVLVNGGMPAGNHQVEWDGKNELGSAVPSGMYIYRIVYGTTLAARKMLLVR